MGFYNLSKEDRIKKTDEIVQVLYLGLRDDDHTKSLLFFFNEDTFVRKVVYRSIGKIYWQYPDLRPKAILLLNFLLTESDFRTRQTAINSAGEIGMKDFNIVEHFFDTGLFDKHPVVRNAVIGSIKKMGEKNPVPVLQWSKKYLHHPDKEIRREVCHGIELRGRTHPEDILPLLKELQHDPTARVRNTLIHVLGQISYKKGCLSTVVGHLKNWENKKLVTKAIAEIIEVHKRYKDFAVLTKDEAVRFLKKNISF